MREILFRGKRVDNGEWVEGYFGKKINVDTLNDDSYIIEPTYNARTDASYFTDILVYEETVGQYTGRKDKNKNKIFEGDLLKLEDSKRYHQLFQIGFCETAAMFCFGKEHQSGFDFTYEEAQEFCLDNLLLNELVVCGNIYYNPELMG